MRESQHLTSPTPQLQITRFARKNQSNPKSDENKQPIARYQLDHVSIFMTTRQNEQIR